MLQTIVFFVPLGNLYVIPQLGTVSRGLGLVAVPWAVLAVITQGTIRRPSALVWLTLALAVLGGLSCLWSISLEHSITRWSTYVQIFGITALTWEFARERDQVEKLIAAFVYGNAVTLVGSVGAYVAGYSDRPYYSRYAPEGFNPNSVGMFLSVAIPMAYYLSLRGGRWGRVVVFRCFVAVSALGVLLTGSRGAFVVGLVASTIVVLTLTKASLAKQLYLLGIIAGAGLLVTSYVPEQSWLRVSTITDELVSGQIGGRGKIWGAGLEVFLNNPLLGTGIGTSREAVELYLGERRALHNAYFAILLEIGIIGLGLFLGIIVSVVQAIRRASGIVASLGWVLLATWGVASLSINWEAHKGTWVVFSVVVGLMYASERKTDGVASGRSARWRRRRRTHLIGRGAGTVQG